MLSGWRIADPWYASTPEQMMSGEGAFLFGGRWNSKGTRVVYLGTSLAQAAMELLVHLGRPDILKTYHKMEVSFSPDLVQHIHIDDLPDDWASPSMAPAVQATGDAWVKAKTSVLLQVPSAAIPGEYNYLFNPGHPDAKSVSYSPITPFGFDPRLLKS